MRSLISVIYFWNVSLDTCAIDVLQAENIKSRCTHLHSIPYSK